MLQQLRRTRSSSSVTSVAGVAVVATAATPLEVEADKQVAATELLAWLLLVPCPPHSIYIVKGMQLAALMITVPRQVQEEGGPCC